MIARRDELRAQLIAIYHQIQKGKLTDLYREFIKAANGVRAPKKKLLRSAEETQRKEFLGLSEMSLSSKTTKARRFNSIQIPLTFCPSGKDVDKVSDDELLEDRIRSLELRLTLHRLNVPPALQK